MTKRQKVIERFKAMPADFTWQELETMLAGFGYAQLKTGKTGGSRVKFMHETLPPVILHKPHPKPVLKRYQLEQIEETLRNEGLI